MQRLLTLSGPEVRAQLLAMSPATIDRLMAADKLVPFPDGISMARTSKNRHTELVPIMPRIPIVDHHPDTLAIDTVAHCGNIAEEQRVPAHRPSAGWTVSLAVKNQAAT